MKLNEQQQQLKVMSTYEMIPTRSHKMDEKLWAPDLNVGMAEVVIGKV